MAVQRVWIRLALVLTLLASFGGGMAAKAAPQAAPSWVNYGNRMALTAEGTAPVPDRDLIISTIITGLGGRPIDQVSLRDLLHDAAARTLQPLTFLGLG